jgi:hypothetical protein
MLTPKIKTVVTDGSVKAIKNLKDLGNLEVYVGIPEAASARKSGAITNAQLVFLHTRGVRTVDVRRQMGAMMLNRGISYQAAAELYTRSKGSMALAIPRRPIIEPAIEAADNKAAITAELKDAAQKQLSGDRTGAVRGMKRAGQEAVNRVKNWFYDPRNHWPPNAPSTIKRKGSSQPLVDSGAMRDAITWVIGEKTK